MWTFLTLILCIVFALLVLELNPLAFLVGGLAYFTGRRSDAADADRGVAGFVVIGAALLLIALVSQFVP